MEEIFGKDNIPPSIRTIVRPPDGWKMVEADFSTAELCVLANLSGDPNMMHTIYTPGMDLHDKSAVDGFGFIMLDGSNGEKEVTMDDIVHKAVSLESVGGDESEEFGSFMKSLIYVDRSGKRYTRSEFKSGPRIAAKAISFSVPYGIAAKSLALQIKSQTHDPRDLASLTVEIDKLITSWKTVSYPVAWNKLVEWQQMVYDPGYIENPWGRRKWAAVRKGESRPDLERQFGNFCMQSLVSDTIQIAMHRLLTKRDELGLKFRLQNQIHDALMVEVPDEELQETIQLMKWSMSEIDIPTFEPGKTFRLGCDVDIYERWGVKMH